MEVVRVREQQKVPELQTKTEGKDPLCKDTVKKVGI